MADLNETLENENAATNAEEVLNDAPVEQPASETEEVPSEPSSELEAEKKTDDVEVPANVPHGEVDPSFNCVPCKGDGLLPSGAICPDCKGTGKV